MVKTGINKIIRFVTDVFFKKQFIKFLAIGTFNTLFGSFVAFAYSMVLQANIAFVFGYITALSAAFFLNSYFVFQSKPSLMKFIKFAFSYLPNFIIQNITIFIVYNLLGFHRMIAFMIAAVIGIPVTFIFLNFFAFKQLK